MKRSGFALLGWVVAWFALLQPAFAAEGGPAGLAELARDAKSEDGNTRRKAVEALGSSRTAEAVSLLAEAYRSEERDAFGVKAACASALGETGLREAAGPLTEMLSDRDYWVRKKAAEALARIPGEEANQALLLGASDKDPRVRARSILSLGAREGSGEAVRKGLEDPDDRVIAASLEALSASRDPHSQETLGGALAHPSWQVRQRAAGLLARRGDPRGLAVLEEAIRTGSHGGAALKEAASVGDPAVPMLTRLFADPRTPERSKVLDALATIEGPATNTFFSGVAGSSGAATEDRVRAATVLFDRRDKLDQGQVQKVAELLGEKETNLVAVALQILLDAGKPEYLSRIAPLARSGDDVVRHFALANLARFGGPEHEDSFVQALSSSAGATVRLALEALARVGTRRSLPAIRPLAQDLKYKRYAQAAVEAIEARP